MIQQIFKPIDVQFCLVYEIVWLREIYRLSTVELLIALS